MDFRKVFDTMDRGWCLLILGDAGVGLKVLCLTCAFWDKSIIICRASSYHDSPFSAKHGVH